MNNAKNRSTLLGVVGAYLIYLAWQLFDGRGETDTTMAPAVRIIFTVFFVLAGAAILIYAVRVWRSSGKEEEQEKPKDDENSLK